MGSEKMNERLEILKDNNIISEITYQFGQKIKGELLETDFAETVEQLDVFLIHLVMSVERQFVKEQLEELDTLSLLEIEKSPYLSQVKKIWQDIEKISPVSFAPVEIPYMYIHLCTICSQREVR